MYSVREDTLRMRKAWRIRSRRGVVVMTMNDLLSVRSDQWITVSTAGRPAEVVRPRQDRSITRSAPRSGFVQLHAEADAARLRPGSRAAQFCPSVTASRRSGFGTRDGAHSLA